MQVRRDWRVLQSSVQVQASSQPDQEYADLSNTAKQLSTDLDAARKQLELDCAAAERFHADMRVQADATQQVHSQLRANTVRREIESCRVCRLSVFLPRRAVFWHGSVAPKSRMFWLLYDACSSTEKYAVWKSVWRICMDCDGREKTDSLSRWCLH